MSDAISNAVAKSGAPKTSGQLDNQSDKKKKPIDRFEVLEKRREKAIPHKEKCLADQETLIGDEKTFEGTKAASYSTNMQKYIKIVGGAKRNAAKRKSVSKANILKGKELFSYPSDKKVPQKPEESTPSENVEPHTEPKLPLRR
jgi:hypothetical protein